ncbi:hypothetical protein [Loktanella agnita]|uniref:hypothetical protein n=1 Tax=Loktanella agnita TaxID=287097 RepID=UPI0039880701
MLARATLFLLGMTSAAQAACDAGEQTFMSCQIAGDDRLLSVCFDEATAHYSFGPAGKPELTLDEPITTLHYTPWPGVGRAIWESVTFHNDAYSYTVAGGFDRMFDDESDADDVSRHFGNVTVRRGETIVAELQCDPETVDFAWGEGLWSAKQAADQEWDRAAQRWVTVPD